MARKPAAPPFDGAYPRPLLQRKQWVNLNGPWDFAIDREGQWRIPEQVTFDQTITVPFAPETPASGVKETGWFQACWYRREFSSPKLEPGQRLILHFGAVDYNATIWINDHRVAEHEGGYTPFQADITDHLTGGRQTIVVRAEDDPHDLAKPRGKQDWEEKPHSIWYYRTSGIWQTVWMEVLPANAVASLHWTPNLHRWEIELEATVDGPRRDELQLYFTLKHGDKLLAEDTCSVSQGQINRCIRLFDPGIDDYRNRLIWRPDQPTLIDVEVELQDADGNPVDIVTSYTAMRSTGVDRNRFTLNGRPYFLRLVLDQGYWPESGLTAPDDAAYRRDVELARDMGFNGVRKHQKIENPRYLYWADRLGLLVWEEMPSPYRFSRLSVRRTNREWTEAITRDRSHPCIIVWVPVNESWGVPDLPHRAEQRDWVRALYHLTKSLDPSRPVVSNDGWEMTQSDLIGIHDYDYDPERIRRRYQSGEQSIEDLFEHERPGHRALLLDDTEYYGQPILLTEFGGVAYSDKKGTWGYIRAKSPRDLFERYRKLLEVLHALPLLSGFCYTQFTDTYQEANGLLTMERKPKFPLEQMSEATRGPQSASGRVARLVWNASV
jgi:beta-galactosidase/beta-glucuronidase